MKRVGIIAGLSAESSANYYLQLARKSNKLLGGNQSVEIIMLSINPDEIISDVHLNNWDNAAEKLIKAARNLEKMRSDCIIIPCNTLHKLADKIQQSVSIPIINIIDCLGNYMKRYSYKNVGLLGTRFTMENEFYRAKLLHQYNINTVTPLEHERIKIHKIIFDELCHGKFKSSSKQLIKNICLELQENHQCESIILGCTELSLIINQDDLNIRLLDTVDIHTDAIIHFSLDINLKHENRYVA